MSDSDTNDSDTNDSDTNDSDTNNSDTINMQLRFALLVLLPLIVTVRSLGRC